MPDIVHRLVIRAPLEAVFDACSEPAGLDAWWTLRCERDGELREGARYRFDFGPEFQWEARVLRAERPRQVVYELTLADRDWTSTRLAFRVTQEGELAGLELAHRGWPEANAHFHTSNHCWGLYLRLLRRWLEHGERVPYDQRLDA